MTPFHLEPETYIYTSFQVPDRKPAVRLYLEADGAVDLYLMDQDAFHAFQDGDDPDWAWSAKRRSGFDDDIDLPYGGPWVFVLMSRDLEVVGGSWEILTQG